jgi:hypothetical protein
MVALQDLAVYLTDVGIVAAAIGVATGVTIGGRRMRWRKRREPNLELEVRKLRMQYLRCRRLGVEPEVLEGTVLEAEADHRMVAWMRRHDGDV